MKIRSLIITLIVFIFTSIMHAQDEYDLELTLKQSERDGIVKLEIYVTNVSPSAVELISHSFSPPWSVTAWFQWKVNDEPAVYIQNIAMISAKDAKWHIPPRGTILWDTISPQVFEIGNRKDWQKKDGMIYPKRIDLNISNYITISAGGSLWKNLRVKTTQILLLKQNKTEDRGTAI